MAVSKHRSAWHVQFFNEDGENLHSIYFRDFQYTEEYRKHEYRGAFKVNPTLITLDAVHTLAHSHYTESLITAKEYSSTPHWSKKAVQYSVTKGHMDPERTYREEFVVDRKYGHFPLDTEEDFVLTLVHELEELQEPSMR